MLKTKVTEMIGSKYPIIVGTMANISSPEFVAAASNAAKIAYIKGGFKAECSEPLMIGQIQILKVGNVADAAQKILKLPQVSLLQKDSLPANQSNHGSWTYHVFYNILYNVLRDLFLIIHLLKIHGESNMGKMFQL